MDNTIWLAQTPDKPLFEDILWSQPTNKARAGKLLIAGGSAHGFAAPASAFSAAKAAGAGQVRVLLPRSAQKILGSSFSEADFAPTTPSGSFARSALDQLIEHAEWADGVLLAGDFGHNSETAILLETFLTKYAGQLSIAGDATDYVLASKSPALSRAETLLVINLGKLQKLAKNNRPSTAVLHNMSLHELVGVMADWTNATPAAFITKHAESLVVAYGGQVSSTPELADSNWQVELAAYAAVWWLQNPSKTFGSLSSSIVAYLGPVDQK
jgi:ADP-dependent NAD(P)H-hydrate dehydratase / NAD(P)H-hydrate epimerase